MTAAALRPPVAPIECTPWCGDGTGHLDAEDPDDQGCYSVGRRVELVRIPAPGHLGSSTHIAVHLYRDAYADGRGGALLEQPHIEIYADDGDGLRLSPGEARELSAVLAEVADAAQQV